MRLTFILIGLLLSHSAYASYDSSWYKAQNWPGEWPQGFAIAKRGVKVMGRSEMDRDLKPSLSCSLPFLAVFHPWNLKGNEQRKVEYWSVSKVVQYVAENDFTYNFGYSPDDKSLESEILVKKGETIDYLTYLSEGNFVIRFRGKEYDAEESLLSYVVPKKADEGDLSRRRAEFDEWLKITCDGGAPGWILKSDLRSKGNATGNYLDVHYIDGIWPAFMPGPGIDDYGKARDLTIKEVKKGIANP